ncbi:MAG TPA: FAD/NAD(P)-binding oxidoreductase, partial [Candidatus Cybelea sp.]|nr:FAD/NAD(P)-binding oxidoreductase [Candidatus Cybelea sp.]
MLQAGAALGIAGAPSVVYGQSKARITIVGGGFGGAAVAKHLRMLDNTLDVTIIEPNPDYVTCPHSNEVIAGLATMADITVSYGRLAQAYGVRFLRDEVRAVDTTRRKITLGSGSVMDYDRLVLAPGVEMRLDAIEGYNAAALEKMPHAWKAGPQTALLRRQLEAMPDGGTVIVAPPINPSRCPPGPYERASLIAHYLKTHKPKSKILIFDAKDTFPHQETFQSVWDSLYPGMIDWYAASSGGTITKVDPAAMTVTTEFGAQKGNVINIIPQQRAPQFLIDASLVDPWGWCPIEPRTLESTLTRHVSIVGDAANGVVMAKSA